MKWYFFAFIRYTLGSLFLLLFYSLSSKLRNRRRFERRYPLKKGKYNVWIHVSSEGELEQVLPYLEANKKDKILLLITSESLEKKIPILDQMENVTASVLPLTNIFPFSRFSLFSLETPDIFIMVRYDFFLELLLVAFNCSRSILMSATLKGKNLEGHIIKKNIMIQIYRVFDLLFVASPQDEDKFRRLGLEDYQKIEQCDFRHGQIIQRQMLKSNLHKTHCIQSFEKIIDKYPREKRLILGSFWSMEKDLINVDLIKDLREKELFLFVAPHKLKGEEWESVESFFNNLEGVDVSHWNHLGLKGEGNVVLCQVPGLLCEIYPYFGHAFVGGGHGRSVHSLLEPYWGCEHIYCGPKTHRSTEADFIIDRKPQNLHIVRELGSLYSILKSQKGMGEAPSPKEKENILQKHQSLLKELVSG